MSSDEGADGSIHRNPRALRRRVRFGRGARLFDFATEKVFVALLGQGRGSPGNTRDLARGRDPGRARAGTAVDAVAFAGRGGMENQSGKRGKPYATLFSAARDGRAVRDRVRRERREGFAWKRNATKRARDLRRDAPRARRGITARARGGDGVAVWRVRARGGERRVSGRRRDGRVAELGPRFSVRRGHARSEAAGDAEPPRRRRLDRRVPRAVRHGRTRTRRRGHVCEKRHFLGVCRGGRRRRRRVAPLFSVRRLQETVADAETVSDGADASVSARMDALTDSLSATALVRTAAEPSAFMRAAHAPTSLAETCGRSVSRSARVTAAVAATLASPPTKRDASWPPAARTAPCSRHLWSNCHEQLRTKNASSVRRGGRSFGPGARRARTRVDAPA